MLFTTLLEALDSCKGSGTWRALADASGVHYDTIARIARGDMKTPSVQTVEKLAAALKALKVVEA